jgi:hypothetical protein
MHLLVNEHKESSPAGVIRVCGLLVDGPACRRSKESEMALVDRPWPINHEYRGVKSKIDFMWGADNDPIPKGLRVEIDHPETPVLASREKAKYASFDNAVEQGKKIAEWEIDQILGVTL